MEIQFKVNNQTVKRIGENKPANHSQEFLKLKFDFMTTDWQGLTKFALFKNIEDIAYRVALIDDTVIVPNAVLQEDRFTFSVYGVNNDDVRATTNQLLIYIAESGYTTDIENDIPDDDPTIVEQIYLDMETMENHLEDEISSKANLVHTHSKSDITDFSHTHVEEDITDLKSYALADHNHDTRYYTESEVDAIIESVKHDLLNRCNFTSDKQIIQTSEIADITSYLLDDGMPKANTTIYFYEKEDN